VEWLAEKMTRHPGDAHLESTYDRTLKRLEIASASESGKEEVLSMLGLGGLSPDQPVCQLSGGQKTRLGLAGVLIVQPSLLLLDEPTNHLDIQMLEWLEGWLDQTRCAVLVVSHDRAFLDNVVSGILELDEHTHTIREYPGNYSSYLQQRSDEWAKQSQEYADQQKEILRLRKAASRLRDQARFHKGGKTDPGNTDGLSIGFFANRGKETTRRAKNMEKRIEQLLSDERVEKPARTWQMKVDFDFVQESGRDVIVLSDLMIGYDGNILLGPLNQTIRYGDRIILTGENGSGKSTLMKTIMGRVVPLSGFVQLGSGVKCGYMAQELETLDPNKTVLEILLESASIPLTEARAFLSKYLFTGDNVFIQVGRLSYGEKVRLMLASLVAGGCNLLLLDEPINHLDIPSRERFEQAILDFQGTVLAVVHDRTFIRKVGKKVWVIDSGNLIEHKIYLISQTYCD
jgi:ATP-binding cassette subfamily F protein 3